MGSCQIDTQHGASTATGRHELGRGPGVPAQWPERRRPTRPRSPSPPQPAPGTRRAAAAGAASRRTGSLWRHRQGAEGGAQRRGAGAGGADLRDGSGSRGCPWCPPARRAARTCAGRRAPRSRGRARRGRPPPARRPARRPARPAARQRGQARKRGARGWRVRGPGATWKFQKWALTKLAWPPSDTVMTSRILAAQGCVCVWGGGWGRDRRPASRPQRPQRIHRQGGTGQPCSRRAGCISGTRARMSERRGSRVSRYCTITLRVGRVIQAVWAASIPSRSPSSKAGCRLARRLYRRFLARYVVTEHSSG